MKSDFSPPDQTTAEKPEPKKNPKRALLKSLLVLAGIAVVIGGLSMSISEQQLDQLKLHLDLGTVIILLVIINLVSFACFLVLYLAYQWIRGDLKPPRDRDFKAPPPDEMR